MAHKKNFVIIGIGQFGKSLASYLGERGYEVTAVDKRKDAIDDVKDWVTVPMIGDATKDELLGSLNFGENTHVIVTIGENHMSALLVAAHLIKKEKVDVKNIYVRTINTLQNEMLRLLGIPDSNLFRVEEAAARRLAPLLTNQEFISLENIDSTYSLAEVRLPESLVGITLEDSKLRKKYHLNLVTVRRGNAPSNEPDDELIGTPDSSEIFQQGDILVLFGKEGDMKKFLEKFPST